MKEKLEEFVNLAKTHKYKIISYLGLFFMATSAAFIYFSFSNVFVKSEENSPALEAAEPLPTPQDDPTTNVLILGMGGAGHEGGSLSDANILVHIDTKNKKAAMITIPRDLWVPIPSGGDSATFNKFNKAHAFGGGELAKQVASVVAGMSVDKYIAVDFVGFQRVFGLLDGVTVDVPREYDDYYYPIKGRELDLCGKGPDEMKEIHEKYSGFELEKQFECRYEHIHFDEGEQEMEGAVALKYVRSRHGDGDFGRSERQLAVLKGIKDELISLEVVKSAPDLLEAIVENVRTDVSIEEIKDFYDLVGNPEEYEIISIQLTEDNVLTSQNGTSGFILIPKDGNNNWTSVHELIKSNLSVD